MDKSIDKIFIDNKCETQKQSSKNFPIYKLVESV